MPAGWASSVRVVPSHTGELLVEVTTGLALMVILNVSGALTQPFNVATTSTVPVPVTPVNDGVDDPVPGLLNPIEGLLFTQPKDAPAGVDPKLTAFTVVPAH